MQFLLPILFSVAAQPAPTLEPVQIVLDEVSFVGKNFKTGKAELLDPLQEMFRKAGFTVLPSSDAVPPGALQIRFTVAAVHDTYGRLAYQVFGRLSEGKDAKLNENLPGQPQRIWFGKITAARSGFEDGMSEIHATLANISALLYRTSSQARGKGSANVVFSVTYPPPPTSTRINMGEVKNLTSLKVKAQGYRPPWPRLAVERRIHGTVLAELVVGEDGKPMRAYVKQGPPELYLHALQWAMGYEFEPAMVDGKPVKAKFVLSLEYLENTMETYSIR